MIEDDDILPTYHNPDDLARLAEAELSRDSWKREAEMNADFGDQLNVALALLKSHGIHVEENWCWCGPTVMDYGAPDHSTGAT